MARSFPIARLFSCFVVDRISVAGSRRGYATTVRAQGVVSSSVEGDGRSGAIAKKGGEDSRKTSPWVPDPVTGYYRPENHADDVDVAELRETQLNNKIKQN
ncbi:hypothetical protein U1Q18_034340 [Sarracenia purpurea var. burkii]